MLIQVAIVPFLKLIPFGIFLWKGFGLFANI